MTNTDKNNRTSLSTEDKTESEDEDEKDNLVDELDDDEAMRVCK